METVSAKGCEGSVKVIDTSNLAKQIIIDLSAWLLSPFLLFFNQSIIFAIMVPSFAVLIVALLAAWRWPLSA